MPDPQIRIDMPGQGGSSASEIPPRGLPIILTHGYDPNLEAGDDGTGWDSLVSAFGSWGWTGEKARVAYYGCDTVYGAYNLSSYGNHAAHGGGPDSHGGYYACYAGAHDRYTPVEHLSYHWAWMVHTVFASNGKCVVGIGHSMGGLIIRYAVAQISLRHPDFPPDVCVRGVATFGTPHAGHDFGCFTIQCSEMQPGSDFLNWLAQNARNPQAAGGTTWTAVGSEDDAVITAQSATSMDASNIVTFLAGSGIHHVNHPNYLDAAWGHGADDRTAPVSYKVNLGPSRSVTTGPWPVRLADLVLAGQALDPVMQGAGPSSPSATSQGSSAAPQPTKHVIVENQQIAIEAQGVAWQEFSIMGTVTVEYSYAVVDDSTEDVGIIRAADLDSYQNGESVSAWAFHSNVQSANDSVTLAAGEYDLVFYCRNDYFDCDLAYSLYAWY